MGSHTPHEGAHTEGETAWEPSGSCQCAVTHSSLDSDVCTLKVKSGWQVETAWEPGGGGMLGKALADVSGDCSGDMASHTCSSGVPLSPVSKVANSSQTTFPRNWVMLLTKIA